MNDTSSRALLERLIGFATVSRESNLEMIGFIRDYLAGFGVESELFYNAEHTRRACTRRSGRAIAAASRCRAIPTWCRSTGRRGRSSRSG